MYNIYIYIYSSIYICHMYKRLHPQFHWWLHHIKPPLEWRFHRPALSLGRMWGEDHSADWALQTIRGSQMVCRKERSTPLADGDVLFFGVMQTFKVDWWHQYMICPLSLHIYMIYSVLYVYRLEKEHFFWTKTGLKPPVARLVTASARSLRSGLSLKST